MAGSAETGDAGNVHPHTSMQAVGLGVESFSHTGRQWLAVQGIAETLLKLIKASQDADYLADIFILTPIHGKYDETLKVVAAPGWLMDKSYVVPGSRSCCDPFRNLWF